MEKVAETDPRRSHIQLGLSQGIVIMAIALWLFSTLSVQAQEGTLYDSPLDRFGFNVVIRYGHITDYDIAPLRAGWYANWWYAVEPDRPGDITFVQTLSVGENAYPPNWDRVAQAIANNPGSIWLVGNEPDTRGQDNRLPEAYAQLYHEYYHFIKSRDPTARVSAAGIVQPTPLRFQWLDRAWAAYWDTYGTKMPVDVWNIHNQILREDRDDWGCGIPPGIEADEGQLYTVYDNASIDLFRQHIIAFRTWMRARGEREKPLIISEYGILQPSSYLGGGDPIYGDQVVRRYMEDTFTYLLTAIDDELGCPADGNRLVQQWSWYSLNDKLIDLETFEGYNGPLFDWRYPEYPGVMTQFGETYAAYTRQLAQRYLYLPCVMKGP
jgi:hypothetical protein